MKKITKFRKEYLAKVDKEIEDASMTPEDFELWIWCKVGTAIDKAYKIGKEEQKNK